MLHKSNFTIETAVANCSGAMEADTILKNGWSSKKQMSRESLIKTVFLFCAIFCTTFAVQGQTFKYTGEFYSSDESLAMYSLLSGDFNITIDLKELSFVNSVGGIKVIDNIKISAFFSTEIPYSKTQSFNFKGIGVFEPNDNDFLDFTSDDKSEKNIYSLRVTPNGIIFSIGENKVGGKTITEYLMDKTDIVVFDYNALVKAIKSKTSNR